MEATVIFLILNLTIFTNAFQVKTYSGYKVFNIIPKNSFDFNLIDQLNGIPDVDIWSSVKMIGVPTVVMVSPDAEPQFKQILDAANLDYKVSIDNLKRVLDAERFQNFYGNRKQSDGIYFNRYNRFDKINKYLFQLAEKYSKIVTLINIGKSFEGRSLNVIKISTGNDGSKPAIFVEGGIHAREWIAHAQVLYIINQLVENRNETSDMTDQVDWYLLPVINPDGYEYSHTVERLWRKTRSINNGFFCRGVDANRNFNFHWNETGTSPDPCSARYAGSKSFSEPETQALSEFVMKIKDQIKMYLAFHSCSSIILYPWGHTDELPDNGNELHQLGVMARESFTKYKDYKVGNLHNILYPASGGSFDWVKGVLGVPLCFTFELPCGGLTGFDMPPKNILPVVSDTFRGIRVFAEYVKCKF